MSPLSNTATSAAAHPPTLWVRLWSSAATLATPWSRAPSSSSVLTPTTPSGMRQSQPAEVSRHQWMGLLGKKQGGYQGNSHRAWGHRGPVICVVQASSKEEVGGPSNWWALLWADGKHHHGKLEKTLLDLPCLPAVCSGEITDSAGVVLSPNWPEPYGRGQDCIWGVHVEEDKRIMLDVRV